MLCHGVNSTDTVCTPTPATCRTTRAILARCSTGECESQSKGVNRKAFKYDDDVILCYIWVKWTDKPPGTVWIVVCRRVKEIMCAYFSEYDLMLPRFDVGLVLMPWWWLLIAASPLSLFPLLSTRIPLLCCTADNLFASDSSVLNISRFIESVFFFWFTLFTSDYYMLFLFCNFFKTLFTWWFLLEV